MLLAGQILRDALAVAQDMVKIGRKVERSLGLPRDSVASAVMSSGTWRAMLPQKDGEAMALCRDLLVAKSAFPVLRDSPTYTHADPELLGQALEDLSRMARRRVASSTLRALVAESSRTKRTPRTIAQNLEAQIAKNPRIFRESDLVYRLLALLS